MPFKAYPAPQKTVTPCTNAYSKPSAHAFKIANKPQKSTQPN
jgi:hypothetical protein